MKKIKKHIPAFLYAFLILIIAALSIYILNPSSIVADGIENGEKKQQTNPDDLVNTSGEKDNPNSQTKNDEPKSDKPDDPTEKDEPKPEPKQYDGIVPRKSTTDELYSYSQRIFGNDDIELCDVIQTSVGIYAIVYSQATQGDVCGEKPCLGIVKLDSYGNILTTLSINDYDYFKYVDACATVDGLVIAAKNADSKDGILFVVSYELSEVKTRYKVGCVPDGVLLATSDSFLFFVEFSEETLVYAVKNGAISFQSVGKGKIVKIFEYGSFYALISTDTKNNNYSCTQISKSSLSVLSETKRDGAVCIDVFPVHSPQGQNFVVLELVDGTTYARKFSDITFTKVLLSKRMGNFTTHSAYFDGENVLIVCKGNVNGVITLSPSLETKINELNSEISVNAIADAVYRNGTLYYLIENDSGKLALIYTDKNVLSIKHFDSPAQNAKIIINLDGSFMLFTRLNDEILIVIL